MRYRHFDIWSFPNSLMHSILLKIVWIKYFIRESPCTETDTAWQIRDLKLYSLHAVAFPMGLGEAIHPLLPKWSS